MLLLKNFAITSYNFSLIPRYKKLKTSEWFPVPEFFLPAHIIGATFTGILFLTKRCVKLKLFEKKSVQDPPFKGRIHPVLEEFEDYLANL